MVVKYIVISTAILSHIVGKSRKEQERSYTLINALAMIDSYPQTRTGNGDE